MSSLLQKESDHNHGIIFVQGSGAYLHCFPWSLWNVYLSIPCGTALLAWIELPPSKLCAGDKIPREPGSYARAGFHYFLLIIIVFFLICRDYYNCIEILCLLCAYLCFDDQCIVSATSSNYIAWCFSKSFKATLINWIGNREHLRCLMQTLRMNLNCALWNERQFPKDFLKFNFKASQVYFILIDLKKGEPFLLPI